MTTRIAITSSLFLGLAMLLIPSAQAMSPPPLHQSDGISTEARYRGVARGYGGYSRYGYRGYGYRGYRPGYGVVRRQVRRCALWGAGHVCRKWY